MWFPHKKIYSQVSANPNIFNIMAGFGRYDHVTKNLIVFGHQCSRGNLIRRLFRDARSTLLYIWLRNKSKAQWSVNL